MKHYIDPTEHYSERFMKSFYRVMEKSVELAELRGDSNSAQALLMACDYVTVLQEHLFIVLDSKKNLNNACCDGITSDSIETTSNIDKSLNQFMLKE